jgi:hypothetical protein
LLFGERDPSSSRQLKRDTILFGAKKDGAGHFGYAEAARNQTSEISKN